VNDAPMLAARGLTKVCPASRKGESIAAVRDATLTVSSNEILAVIGPNGAGKTTLIDLLATVLSPSSGSLCIAGRDAAREPGAARRRLGYVPSGGRSLFPRLTALQNLRFFATLHEAREPDTSARAHALLHLCGASEIADTRVDRLSDGFVSRVSLARALLNDPSVLLLDEPARSIDPVARPAILSVIRQFVSRGGKAAVMVTHDLADVFEVCDRVAIMQRGRITRIEDVVASPDRARFYANLEGHVS
jgi:ABC-type multidrug transport system ATPase subunit